MSGTTLEIGYQTPSVRRVRIYLRSPALLRDAFSCAAAGCGSFQSLVGAKGTLMNRMQCSDKPISNSKWAS